MAQRMAAHSLIVYLLVIRYVWVTDGMARMCLMGDVYPLCELVQSLKWHLRTTPCHKRYSYLGCCTHLIILVIPRERDLPLLIMRHHRLRVILRIFSRPSGSSASGGIETTEVCMGSTSLSPQCRLDVSSMSPRCLLEAHLQEHSHLSKTTVRIQWLYKSWLKIRTWM